MYPLTFCFPFDQFLDSFLDLADVDPSLESHRIPWQKDNDILLVSHWLPSTKKRKRGLQTPFNMDSWGTESEQAVAYTRLSFPVDTCGKWWSWVFLKFQVLFSWICAFNLSIKGIIISHGPAHHVKISTTTRPGLFNNLTQSAESEQLNASFLPLNTMIIARGLCNWIYIFSVEHWHEPIWIF